jgi:ubiquinone/menaquinone biosynthesis C-methylase UbiE
VSSAFAHDSPELAARYHQVSELQFESGKRLVDRLGLQPGARVLDVGCGTGRLTQWMASRAGQVVGIDPVEERIRFARSSNTSSARFEVGRAEALSAFEDSSFDVVCLSSVLHWVEDKARALAEARRVLRPGGRLGVTTTPSELSRAGTWRCTLESVLARAPFCSSAEAAKLIFARRGATTSELIELVLGSGLELRELHVERETQAFADGEAVLGFMEASSFGTFLKPVSEPLRTSLRAALVTAFDEQPQLVSWGVCFTADLPLSPTLSPGGGEGGREGPQSRSSSR